MPERLEDTLRRLEQERDEADRRYNDALTALDRARPSLDPPPAAPRAFDDRQLGALNEAWNIIPGPPAGSGIKSRIARIIWRAVAPYFNRQLTFNSLLVDHLNRTAEAALEAQRAAEGRDAALGARLAALNDFIGHLLLYLQQITAYVDTKDRSAASGALVLNAAISGMAANLEKRWESLNARFESRTMALETSQETHQTEMETLRTALSASQQVTQSLKRELERVLVGSPAAAATHVLSRTDHDAHEPFAATLDAVKYVGFEDMFRGSRELIRTRFESYVPLFANAQDVLDVGCGRGEFLELLRTAGVSARGIDINHEMVERCRERGLDVLEADAVGYLSAVPDASLGGLFAAQVVEHLQPAYLLRFLELAFHKLRPGSRIVLETINPACWAAFFDSFIRDITHAFPLHPDTLKYLVLASGFSSAEVDYRAPIADRDKLQPVHLPPNAPEYWVEIAGQINANVHLLNGRMFTFRDYALIGTK